jgi:hypothetical protein
MFEFEFPTGTGGSIVSRTPDACGRSRGRLAFQYAHGSRGIHRRTRNHPNVDDGSRQKRFAGTVESLAHRRGRGVVEPNVLDRSDSHKHLRKARAGAQKRLSVTEARSRFGDP